MVVVVLLFIAGIGLLVQGGDFFVGSSVYLAERTRLPRMVVGGTIVSVATTTPEFVTSVTAGLAGASDLSVGNAVGSVLANIGLVAALLALLRPFRVRRGEFGFPAWAMLGAAALLVGLTWDLGVTRWKGALMLALGAGYLWASLAWSRHSTRRARLEAAAVEELVPVRRLRNVVLLFLLGLAMVVGGANLTVYSGVRIAEALNVPPLVIGLTLVAVGTSLPELVRR